MIHDILLSLFHPNPDMLDMYKLIVSKKARPANFPDVDQYLISGHIRHNSSIHASLRGANARKDSGGDEELPED